MEVDKQTKSKLYMEIPRAKNSQENLEEEQSRNEQTTI